METSDFLNGDVERVMADAPPASRNDGGGGGGASAMMASPRLGGDDQPTPTIGASGAPSLKPVPSSSGSVSSGSRHDSPINIQTPSSVLNKQKVSKSGASGRGGKRGSVSSSPGLQPKISPSIKPLLPSGEFPRRTLIPLFPLFLFLPVGAQYGRREISLGNKPPAHPARALAPFTINEDFLQAALLNLIRF